MLPSDSLAFALERAARLVSAVLEGGNLTDAYERMQEAQPPWSDAARGAIRDLAWSTLRDFRRGSVVLDRLLHTMPAAPIHALLLVALKAIARAYGLSRPREA